MASGKKKKEKKLTNNEPSLAPRRLQLHRRHRAPETALLARNQAHQTDGH